MILCENNKYMQRAVKLYFKKGGTHMKFYLIDEQASQYFIDIDSASDMLGVSRRTFFDYAKQVQVRPEERRRMGQKIYFAEGVVARMWVHQRRHERDSVEVGKYHQDGALHRPYNGEVQDGKSTA